jgi:hypothetical protein
MDFPTVFFIANDGERLGPLTREQAAQLIERGVIGSSALIWTEGLSTWQPIALHFSDSFAAQQAKASKPGDGALDTSNTPPEVKASFKARPARLFLSLLLTLVSTGAFLHFRADFAKLESPELSILVWISAIMVCTASACFLASEIWPSKKSESSPSNQLDFSGVRKVFASFSGIAIFCLAVIYLSQSWVIYQVSKARLAYGNYEFKVDVVSHSIDISGTIGPDLGRKVRDALNTYSGIEFIKIKSPGGLIDEALDAANAIEGHANITLLAEGECNSACIPILLSGREKFADGMMSLGFHASDAITNIGANNMPALSDISDEYYSYLERHSVPQSVIDDTKALGPKSLDSVPSIDLVDSGVITGVTFDGSRVPISMAKWLYVEKKAESGSTESLVGSLLAAIRSVDTSVVDAYSDRLYKSATSKDPNTFQAAIASLTGSVKISAINSAEPDAVFTYIQINAEQLESLRESELWDVCKQYALGSGVSDTSKLSSKLLNAEIESLVVMVKSGGQSHWQARPLPDWAEKVGRAALGAAAQKIASQGLTVKDFDTSPKTACAFSTEWFSILAQLKPITAVSALRWLNSSNTQ